MKANRRVAPCWQLWDEARFCGEQTQFSSDQAVERAIVTPRNARTMPLRRTSKSYYSPERLELLRSFRLDNGANGMTSSMASRYEVLD